jgi:hypothetical protein
MVGLKTFFKARKKISLEGVSPSDDAFLLEKDSESSIFPPSQEDTSAPGGVAAPKILPRDLFYK